MLERAEVIEHPSTDPVGLGSTVTIRSDDGEEETYTLVDHVEADIRDGFDLDRITGRCRRSRQNGPAIPPRSKRPAE